LRHQPSLASRAMARQARFNSGVAKNAKAVAPKPWRRRTRATLSRYAWRSQSEAAGRSVPGEASCRRRARRTPSASYLAAAPLQSFLIQLSSSLQACSRCLAARCARVWLRHAALDIKRGRREGRELAAPMVRVQQESTRQNHRFGRDHPDLPCAMVLTLIRALLGDRLSCPRRRRNAQALSPT
jgi:hypothetical protein